MNQALLASLLRPVDKVAHKPRFTLRIDGQVKTGKTNLALTASADITPIAQWSRAKPQTVNDILWLGFEENCLMFAETRGIRVANALDWSSAKLTYREIRDAIVALPDAVEEYKKVGVTTIVVDSLSAFDDLLIRDLITMAGHTGDMARIRAYGQVNEAHMLLFDMLRKTELNIIGLVHLVEFAPFGEEGGSSQVAQAMAKQAEKQVHKIEASAVGGHRSDFVAAMRPKAASRWARLSDAVICTYVEQKVIRAGVTEPQYRFSQSPSDKFAAGGRWDLSGSQEPNLYPILKRLYNIEGKQP